MPPPLSFQGSEQPIILVALPNTSANRTGPRGRSSYWARVRALDTGFDRLWQKDFCAAGHAPHKLDTDSDGLAEALFLGKYKIDAQGNTLCTLPIGNDHADGLQVGDIIPTREGFELAEVGESGGEARIPHHTPGSGAPRSPTLRPLRSATSNSGRNGLEVVMQQRPSEQNRTIHIYAGGGSLIKSILLSK